MRVADSSHRVLRTLLLILAILQALAGVLLLFWSGWFLSLIPAAAQIFSPELIAVTPKVFAMIAFFVAILAFAASRDPVRNVAIIDAFIFLLFAAVVLDVYASWIVHVSPLFAGPWALVRIIVRTALAIILIVLRPRATTA